MEEVNNYLLTKTATEVRNKLNTTILDNIADIKSRAICEHGTIEIKKYNEGEERYRVYCTNCGYLYDFSEETLRGYLNNNPHKNVIRLN